MYKIFVVTGLRDGWKSSRSIEYYDQVYKDVNLKVDRVISGSLPESAGSKCLRIQVGSKMMAERETYKR